MTRDDLDDLSSDEQRAREVVRGLPVVGTDPGFRQSLGDLFARGTIAGELPGAPIVELTSARRRPLRRPLVWILTAVAALWMFSFVRGREAVYEWEFVGCEGRGTIWLDEESHDSADLLHKGCRSGARIRTDADVGLELVSNAFAIELSPGADVTLPVEAGAGLLQASVRSGIATWVTGRGFPGRALVIEAPDAEVRVLGTTFAVLADDEKTCVSVFEGEVGVCTPDGEETSVTAGRCRRIYRAPEVAATDTALNDGQIASLTHWHARSQQILAAPRSR